MTAVSSFFVFRIHLKSARFHGDFRGIVLIQQMLNNETVLATNTESGRNIQSLLKCCGMLGYEDYFLDQSRSYQINMLSGCCIDNSGNSCLNQLTQLKSYKQQLSMSNLIYCEVMSTFKLRISYTV